MFGGYDVTRGDVVTHRGCGDSFTCSHGDVLAYGDVVVL